MAYRQSLRYRPNYFPTFLNLGYALKDGGRVAEAAAAWEQAARLAPHDPVPRYELSQIGRGSWEFDRSCQLSVVSCPGRRHRWASTRKR